MISWNEDFRLGVKEIDEQHMQLFNIAGRAYELLRRLRPFRWLNGQHTIMKDLMVADIRSARQMRN